MGEYEPLLERDTKYWDGRIGNVNLERVTNYWDWITWNVVLEHLLSTEMGEYETLI